MRSTIVCTGMLAAALALDGTALACGCFTPPDPSVAIVQAGEQIVFAADGQHVTAHVKIQYAGDAKDFGWLVPLPSVPKVALSTDELFAQVETATQPVYRLNTVREACMGRPESSSESFGCGASEATAGAAFDAPNAGGDGAMQMTPNPALVSQDSIGPYDFAVLKADDKTALLDWLDQNHYFVPATNNDVLGPYLHPGAYFLALKLKAGRTVGDLQPIAISYDSDLPMIPIVLTSVGAQPNLGIQVFLLGPGRGIPRNYHHTVLDDMAVDWTSGNLDYTGLVIRAVSEAPKHHTFVTEYAGTSALMQGKLAPNGRFGDLAVLRTITDAPQYLDTLLLEKYPFNPVMFEILERYIPAPADVIAAGVTPEEFYSNIRYYLGANYQNAVDPDGGVPDGGVQIPFNPAALTDEIDARIVEPTRAAEQMFYDHAVLTRLYTTLSPEDMTEDPVFSFNSDLPEVGLAHEATLDYPCGGTPYLEAQGFKMIYPGGRAPSPTPALPASLRVEALAEAGAPKVEVDNGGAIGKALAGLQPETSPSPTQSAGSANACSVLGGPRGRADLALCLLVGLAILASRRRGARR